MRRILLITIISLCAVFWALPAEDDWPREIETEKGRVVVYQPQVDSFEKNIMEGRAAVSVLLIDSEAPVFGAVWFRSKVSVDRDTRLVELLEVEVPNVRFPDLDEEQGKMLAAFLEKDVHNWDFEIDLDRLLASLPDSAGETPEADLIKNDPPKVVVTNEPAVLILIDGEPRLQNIEGVKDMQRVVNTPYTLVHLKSSDVFYLDAGKAWYSARKVSGPWSVAHSVPPDVAKLRQETGEKPTEEDEMEKDERIPMIVVATEPTELIFIDGNPSFAPIQGTDLLYVNNTDSDVLMDIAGQKYYIILSGRWFASKSLDGPWSFVRADELPDSFENIPEESENGHLLANVAGTDQAREAVLDASIPQTAAVKLDATTSVEYDGKPQFKEIEGTDMQYAVNTPDSILKIDGKYYCCKEAVWYIADKPEGPWAVCTSVPEKVQEIPASSPVQNVKYVYVYETTPQVVYVGYTPAYTGCYVYHGVPVYGTGWYYPSWYGRYYYPRPATYGFHVRYNPWTGWSFGFSYSNGPFRFTIGYNQYWGGGGWFGPARYRPYPPYAYRHGYRAGYHRGYWAGYNQGRHGSPRPTPYGRNVNINTRDINIGNKNIYNRPQNRDRVVQDRPAADRRPTNKAATRENNILTDRQGNVYRRNQDGSFDRRENKSWNRDQAQQPATRPSTGTKPTTRDVKPSTGSVTRPSTGTTRPSTPTTRPSAGNTKRSTPSTLQRDYNSRQRGQQRSNTYQRSRQSTPQSNRSSGGGRRR